MPRTITDDRPGTRVDPRASHHANPRRHVFACGMSRSGTTLLTTILDSHPGISMGYELLPAGLPPAARIEPIVNDALNQARVTGSTAADVLKANDNTASLATFLRHCGRCGVEPTQVIDICRHMHQQGVETFESLEMRAKLSMAVVETKRAAENTHVSGYKINAPSVEFFADLFTDSAFVYIVRDPRDVVASHFTREFDRTLEHIVKAWVNYADKFLALHRTHPRQTLMIRYEDLVRKPDQGLARIFDVVGLPVVEEVRHFHHSKASVHQHGHANTDELKRDFFTSSIGRWMTQLTREQVRAIQKACGPLMERMGYVLAPLDEPVPVSRSLHAAKTREFALKKKFYRDQYKGLLAELRGTRPNLTWAEAARGELHSGEEIFIIRHDVDHDYETARRIAAWETANGYRATYCMLHTSWYYGELHKGVMRRWREMLDACLEIQALGHEINLHNNFAVTGLLNDVDPCRLMAQELMFLRMNGVNIVGSSTHGDGLCRELDFRNYELFSESVYPSRGGPRIVKHKGRQVSLGQVSMREFGLEYEAYDIPRDLYITDSGGDLRKRTNTRGRAGLRRDELQPPPPYPYIVGILTHPVWWDFERDAPNGQPLPAL